MSELQRTTIELSEHLRLRARATIVNPLIKRLWRATLARFRKQGRLFKRSGLPKIKASLERGAKAPTDSELDSAMAAGLYRFRYPRFKTEFEFCFTKAYRGGAAIAGGELRAFVLAEARRKQTEWQMRMERGRVLEQLRAEELERELDATTESRVATAIRDGFEKGLTYDAVSKFVDSIFDDIPRAETVAITEVAAAFNRGGADFAAEVRKDNPTVEIMKTWSAEPDACDECTANVDDGPIPEDLPFSSGNNAPPAHPNCLPGKALVAAAGVSAAFKRWFEGELCVLRTSAGTEISITPNHPICTAEGFVAAERIQVGDSLLKCINPSVAISLVDPNDNHVHSLIKDVADSFLMSGGVAVTGVPTTTEAFHGDGFAGEVQIVRPTGNLTRETQLRNDFINTILGIAHRRRLGLDCLSSEAQRLNADLTATSGIMGGGSQSGAFGLGCSGHARNHGSATVADVQPGGLESAVQGDAAAAQPLSHRLNAFASLMKFEQVVWIGKRKFAGHVFNLETAEQFYFADSILVHNCRCSVYYSNGATEEE